MEVLDVVFVASSSRVGTSRSIGSAGVTTSSEQLQVHAERFGGSPVRDTRRQGICRTPDTRGEASVNVNVITLHPDPHSGRFDDVELRDFLGDRQLAPSVTRPGPIELVPVTRAHGITALITFCGGSTTMLPLMWRAS
jgi:hypothetical protein